MGRNPAGLFDVEMCEQMTVSAPTRQAMGLRHSSIVYTNAQVLEWDPDFRLVSGAANSLSRGSADLARVNTPPRRRLFDYCTIETDISASAPARR